MILKRENIGPVALLCLSIFMVFLFVATSWKWDQERTLDYTWEIQNSNPPSLDADIMNRIWSRLKKETGAPDHILPPPIVLDWDVPATARMGFQYPDAQFPDIQLAIKIAPRTIDKMESEPMVQWSFGHELTHYLFLMRENGWKEQSIYKNQLRHHCNPEFLKVTGIVADVIWDVYHDDTERNRMRAAADQACQNHPEQ